MPGITLTPQGLHLAVTAPNATRVWVSFYDGETETRRIPLPDRHGGVHAGFIAGIKAGQRYGLRAEGLLSSYDPAKLLIDPMAPALDRAAVWHPDLARPGAETGHLMPKCIVTEALPQAQRLPPGQPAFIYELQVKSFTALHPDIPAAQRGTVAALAHPAVLGHLARLGVDTVELMPLMAWIDERHLPPLGLANAWGYNPISFFAPDPRLAPGGLAEIRNTVAALHSAGIRVVLDVVFNHSGESDEHGATLSLRGLDEALYYRHAGDRLVNDTGCGNTLALDRAPVVALVMDALRHWVNTTGLDGFRYDLATVMGRTPRGFDPDAPLLSAIQQDPLLSDLIHIAEPWDVGPEGYRLGEFPVGWREWNNRYRDDIRRFWRGDAGAGGALATRLAGSSDVFAAARRRPSASINYLAAHDGFTLADTVRFEAKHNHANGEANRDGDGHEVSWSSATPDHDIAAMLATLFLSRGTPMLTAGDEFGRSQSGNNNAYAQDNALTWLNWTAADSGRIAQVGALAAFRREHAEFFAGSFFTGAAPEPGAPPDAQWFGPEGVPDWRGEGPDVLGLAVANNAADARLLMWFNRKAEPATIQLPDPLPGMVWRQTPPSPFIGEGQPRSGRVGEVAARAVTLFIERPARHASAAPDDALIAALAKAAGIAPQWWEVDGTHHAVSPETKRALLAAMAVPIASHQDARTALREITVEPRLPQTHVAAANAAFTLQAPGERRTAFTIAGEDGVSQQVIKPAGADHLQLPALAAGVYSLTADDDPAIACRLLISPGACYLPDDLARGARRFGLAAHLYALRDRRDWGIGDFETLARFGEAARGFGAALVGLNPLHHMFPRDRSRVSPYQPSDRRFLDPIYIDAGSLSSTPREAASLRQLKHADYAAVWALKDRELRRCHAAFERSGGDPGFKRFIAAGGKALHRHAEFEAQGQPADERYHKWLQWLADAQLAAAAKRSGIGFYRDLALGSAYEGGEVWANPELYASTVSLGAPPDPFSAAGQIWNLPPFVPQALARAGFAPFRDILSANMRHAAALRIDHILGFARQFWVPRGATGAEGAYVTVDQEALIALTAIESHRAACLVIGEDLGTVPAGLRQRMAQARILSYRMLWFEQDGAGFHPPAGYPALSAACLSSHDLKPFQGWRASASAAEIATLTRAIAAEGLDPSDLLTAAHALVARTPSALMLVQADDLTGETEPLNVPGTDRENPNWRRRLRLPVEDLSQDPTAVAVIAAAAQNRST